MSSRSSKESMLDMVRGDIGRGEVVLKERSHKLSWNSELLGYFPKIKIKLRVFITKLKNMAKASKSDYQ